MIHGLSIIGILRFFLMCFINLMYHFHFKINLSSFCYFSFTSGLLSLWWSNTFQVTLWFNFGVPVIADKRMMKSGIGGGGGQADEDGDVGSGGDGGAGNSEG